jgi:hypothetical protein
MSATPNDQVDLDNTANWLLTGINETFRQLFAYAIRQGARRNGSESCIFEKDAKSTAERTSGC